MTGTDATVTESVSFHSRQSKHLSRPGCKITVSRQQCFCLLQHGWFYFLLTATRQKIRVKFLQNLLARLFEVPVELFQHPGAAMPSPSRSNPSRICSVPT